ncbi:MerR family transcriptional regulator [Pseudoflavonifractor phocaeensis]|uniref:MerR family transcriptional regulator n=1 Tax=Pseudoflavonifractor phocaeensis TaxID=1870988 RepID=UPI001F1D84BC|nr:MerR family transcriptional regulator [Pseudoflavonifractor phocaeensis]
MEMKQEHKPCEVKDSGTLYKIGMFAAMNHVTVKTLRFYEEQGLLMPALIHSENGYRYYTLSQMAVIHQITALKMAGFTLEEIVRINSGADEEAVLLKKKSELLAKISDLTRQIAIVDGYLSKKKTCLSAPVLIKTIPETNVAFMRTRLESYDGLFDRMPEMGALMEKAGCVCALPEYCFTNYLEPGYKDGDILVEICESVMEAKQEIGDLRFKTLPEIQAACVFHKGSYRTFSESYETVLRYIEENGYEIAGEIRESYIDGVWNKDDESEWLSEIQVPVRRKTGTPLK